MITITSLIDQTENFSMLSQKEQVKLMGYFWSIENQSQKFNSKDIKIAFEKENLKLPSNISDCFLKLTKDKPQKILQNKDGFSFERNARKELDIIYQNNPHIKQTSSTLRGLISKLTGIEQQSFLEEAISCFEIKSYRASIVMTWLLAMDTIYEYVIANKLVEFNQAVQAHGKYKKITFSLKDQFTDIKETDFLELLRTGKIITNDVRKILEEKLDFRNTCAHPNSIIIKYSKAISFIEDLVENVISKF